MKTITLLGALMLPLFAQATQPRLMKVTLPLWFMAAADSDKTILISEVPGICGGTDAAAWFGLFTRPLHPDGAQADVNLISNYRIGISAEQAPDGAVTGILIDLSRAEKPLDFPFEVTEVAEQVVVCMRREFPDEGKVAIVITPAGQERNEGQPKSDPDGAGQPATRPETRSTGSDKTQPEPERRPRLPSRPVAN